jgi:Mg2+-importing ATPase
VLALPITRAGVAAADEVLRTLGSDRRGLSEQEVLRRRAAVGPNAVRSHHARPWVVLGRQLASPLLVTALVSFVVGERTDAVIIGLILAASVGLGFVNEYRAERAAEALHSAVRHVVVVSSGSSPGTARSLRPSAS